MSSDRRTSKTKSPNAHGGQKQKRADRKASRPSNTSKKRWGFWRVLSWGSAALLIIILLICAYIWQNRYALLETAFEDIIAQQGLQADISIQSLDQNGARLGKINIAADGEPIFSADSLLVDYDWREALEGRMKRVEFSGASLRLTVDKQGKIIDGWLPEPRGDQPLVLPPGGLHLSKSRIEILSPYGPVKASGDLTFLSFENLKADVTIEPSQFAFGALRTSGGGKITANIAPGKNFISGELDFTALSHPLGEIGRANVTADVNFDLVDGLSHISGPLAIRFSDLKSERLSAGSGQLDWDGGFAVRPNSAAIREADGHWDISASQLSYGTEQSRHELAKTITLYDAMSAAPVTTHFAKGLTHSIKALLYDAELSGRGGFLRSGDDVQLTLKSPLRIDSRKTSAVISPLGSSGAQEAGKTTPFYAYNRQSEVLELKADANISGARPLNLLGLKVMASSPNGLTLETISDVSVTTEISDEWRADASEGPVRLAATRADVRFINRGGLREMTARLPFDYDGPLPGGYARGLLGRGALRLDMRGGGLKTYFAPEAGTPIQAAEFVMPSGWSAHGALFTLPPSDKNTPALYQRLADGSGVMAAQPQNVTMVLRETATGRELSVDIARAELSGRIAPAQQDWDVALSEAEITTDDFVGNNAVFGAPTANVTARLIPGQDVYFTLEASAARAKTDQLSAPAIMIAIEGTPANYRLDFGGESYASAGKIAFAAAELPELPLRGSVGFKDGKFTGESFTVLPKAEDVPIEISFDMQEGRGNAKILIPQLTFAPRKLQPQNLVPSLQGKIADVTGTVSAQIDVSFSPDAPLQSFGSVKIHNLNFGTLPGPFTGVSTEIQLTSVFPLQSSGMQTLTVEKFNPGLPLENGTISYELIPNAIRIIDASWPMGDGAIALEPVIWRFDQTKNRVVLTVDDVDLGDLLGGFGGEDLKVTGDVTGKLPVLVDGVNVRVEGGVMRVVDGGLIQFSLNPKRPIEATADELNNPNQLSQMALESLRNLRYETLEVRMDGPLDGPMTVAMSFLGSNPDVLYGAQFKFNTVIEGELFNIARSLKPGSNLSSFKRYIEADRKSGGERPAN